MFNPIDIFNKIEQIQSLDPQGLYIYVCVCIHIMYTYLCVWVCAYVCICRYTSWDINGMIMGNTLR